MLALRASIFSPPTLHCCINVRKTEMHRSYFNPISHWQSVLILKVHAFCVSDVACPQIALPSPYSQIVNRETAMLSSCLLLICVSSFCLEALCALYQAMGIRPGMPFFCILSLNSIMWCPVSGHACHFSSAFLVSAIVDFSLFKASPTRWRHCLTPTSLSHNQKY